MTSAFLTKLVLEDEGDGVRMTLAQPLVYRSALFGGAEIVVQQGFETDFASIPRWLWNVIPPHGSYDHGAVLHDLAYRTGAINGQRITKAQADALFGEAMTVRQTATRVRWTILAGLRLGGFVTWNRYRAAAPATVPAVGGGA